MTEALQVVAGSPGSVGSLAGPCLLFVGDVAEPSFARIRLDTGVLGPAAAATVLADTALRPSSPATDFGRSGPTTDWLFGACLP